MRFNNVRIERVNIHVRKFARLENIRLRMYIILDANRFYIWQLAIKFKFNLAVN